MYHIVFNSDEKYVKYMAVLISSIVNNTNKNNEIKFDELLDDENINEKYVFHVLVDYICDSEESKLVNLQNKLSKIYPTEIIVHKISDEYFKKNKMVKLGNSYSTYFRLKIPSILSNNIKKCLYLDIDMLVLCDIREIFKIKLEDKLFGMVSVLKNPWPSIVSKYDNNSFLELKGPHFNSGMMLINLVACRAKNFEYNILNSASNYNIPYAPDEYILNAFLDKESILPLELKWNFLIGFRNLYLNNELSFIDNGLDSIKTICYNEEEFNEAFENIKIVHYTYLYMPKPWENFYGFIDDNYNLIYYEFYDKWWEFAVNTPVFGGLFSSIKLEFEKKALLEYSKAMSVKIKNLENKITHSSIACNLNIGACNKVRNHLSYKVGKILINNYKGVKVLFLPFKLIFAIFMHKISFFIYNIIEKNNPNFKTMPLNAYDDYKDALKIQDFFSYKLGKLFLKNPFTFIFKIKCIKKVNK